MCRVGGNAWEEKERFIVQDNVRGHEENGNKLTMTASPRGSAETPSCEVPRLEETRVRNKLPLRSPSAETHMMLQLVDQETSPLLQP